MRSYLPAYDMISAKSLAEALALLQREPGVWKPLAGGTDLMVLLEAGQLAHYKFVNIWNVTELRGIEEGARYITLGALTTYTQVLRNALLQREFPLLCQAARETGGIATQNRGTLGGNIVNASPAADSPPALLVYDAQIELASASGSRWVPYAQFHTGYKQMVIRPDELLSRIRLPRRAGQRRHYFRKVGTRKAQAISKVCFAGLAQLEGGVIEDIRIALGSVAPTVIRCFRTEEFLRGRRVSAETAAAATAQIAREISPIDDMRSTTRYRRRVVANLLQDFLSRA